VIHQFDDFVVDPVAFRLFKGEQAVHIEPKALQILIVLLERCGQLVTKQDLFSQLWPGVAVTENALTRAIAQLRKTLGDSADEPRYIETVPTRGYRFIGTLGDRKQPAATSDAAPPPSPQRRRYLWILPPFIVLALASAVLVMLLVHHILQTLENRMEAKQQEREPPPIAANILRVSPRLEVSPSFSPDGASIVYSADAGGTPHLFISAIDGSGERRLTNGEDGEAQPSWSPDGKRIAFTSIGTAGIWIVDAGGGKPVRLTPFGSRPSWSPDGTQIAFQSSDDIEYGWNAYEALPPSTIWIVDLETKKARPLTVPGTHAGGHGAPSWRPDGKRIAFSSCDHERCGIFTIALNGSGLTEVATDPRRLSSPLFSPTGTMLYYVRGLYDNSRLVAVAVDADGHRAGSEHSIRQSNSGVMQSLALSRDGFRFAWSLVAEKNDLFVADIGSSDAPKQLTRNPTHNATFPTFSPDSRKIAFCAVTAGDDSGLWIANADGSNPKALITGEGLKQYARWQSSEWDVFYGAWSVAAHRPVLYRASLATGGATASSYLPEDASAPMISPDLKRVAFNRTIEGKTSVWVSALDGSSLQRMSDDADLARFPVWSPDGTRLAVQMRGHGSAIAILPGPKVVVTGGENWPHSWSPNGKEIAFAGRRNGVWNVFTVNIGSGKTRKVTAFTSMTGWVRTPSWSPDGKRIAFEAGEPRAAVWISEPRAAQ
jgi:Tol biopolymer transport system component/DNA-binding winged helix-turn-helix (wHTH) protein